MSWNNVIPGWIFEKLFIQEPTRISQEGIDLIKSCEGCRLRAYTDSVGVWTIGYGHTETAERGMVITAEEAEELLRADLRRFESGVKGLVAVELTQGQFDALVSFSFNVGLGNLRRSTLLRKLNEGNYTEASKQFLRWTKAGGKELKGLVKRRQAEQDLFNS